MKKQIKYIPHVECPECGKTSSVNHLNVNKCANYKWFCDRCGTQYAFTLSAGDDYEIEKTGTKSIKTNVLLKLPVLKEPLYLIVEGMRFEYPDGHPDKSEDEQSNHDEYFYNEHTCPTNYLKKAEEIFYKGQDDWHGIFEYIKTIPYKKEVCLEDFDITGD